MHLCKIFKVVGSELSTNFIVIAWGDESAYVTNSLIRGNSYILSTFV